MPGPHRCHGMPGHSYRVELTVAGPVDPRTGWVVAFFDMEAIFAPVLLRLDHYCLNEVEGLENPTAENIAAWIWHRTKDGLPGLS
ncbi:6-pyruvoyl trahydropterin synthase family protein, partial [Escherichia coli]|uniref:6-pyruvoyl trahydropterin synthase family protein n=1 Tax=Escherichia coli TaxID=562 RepID=UPI0005C4D247